MGRLHIPSDWTCPTCRGLVARAGNDPWVNVNPQDVGRQFPHHVVNPETGELQPCPGDGKPKVGERN